MADDEELRKEQKPSKISPDRAAEIAHSLFGLNVERESVRELDSYDDRNFYVRGTFNGGAEQEEQRPRAFTLKIHNGVESADRGILEAQNGIMAHLHGKGFRVPHPNRCSDGSSLMAFTELPAKSDPARTCKHAVRLLSWVEGKILHDKGVTEELLASAGSYLGRLRHALEDFDHASAHRVHLWDIQQIPNIRPFIPLIDNEDVRHVATEVVDAYEAKVEPVKQSLPHGILMADFNDSNMIVKENDDGSVAVDGVIDFGDIVYSPRVNDIAIAAAYSMIEPPSGLGVVDTAAKIIGGYCSTNRLRADEIALLRILVACRLTTSVTLGALSISKDPENEYLKRHAEPGRRALLKFWRSDAEAVSKAFLDAVADKEAS